MRIITLENNLTEREKDIVQLKEELKTWKNGAKQFEKVPSTSEQEISQLPLEKTALENKQFEEDLSINCDTRAELTKEKARIITLESKLTDMKKENIQLREKLMTISMLFD